MSSDAAPIALITGAGRGIGRAVALAMAEAGYALALTGRNAAPLHETAALTGRPADCLVAPADVSNPAAVEALFDAIRERFGRLDVLFNNAGVSAPAVSIEDLAFEEWSRSIDVNLTAAFLCTQQAFRLMKSQNPRGGRIINNGSIAAHSPRPKSAAYAASKHGMTGLTKATSLDGRPYDIACGQIDIGNAATDMAKAQMAGAEQADGSFKVEPVIDAALVGRTVVHMAGLPLGANVQFITLMATKMPFIGRG